MFPYYLSIGMSDTQYWDGDNNLVKYYRQAEEMRMERKNQEAWLQGMYIYDAISRLSPILHAFAKKGTKAAPYVDKPYPVSEESVESAKELQEKAKADKARRFMEAFAVSNNKRFKGEGESNG